MKNNIRFFVNKDKFLDGTQYVASLNEEENLTVNAFNRTKKMAVKRKEIIEKFLKEGRWIELTREQIIDAFGQLPPEIDQYQIDEKNFKKHEPKSPFGKLAEKFKNSNITNKELVVLREWYIDLVNIADDIKDKPLKFYFITNQHAVESVMSARQIEWK